MAWSWREGTIETHNSLIELCRDRLPGYRILHGDRYESGEGVVSAVGDDGSASIKYHLPESVERISQLCREILLDDESRRK